MGILVHRRLLGVAAAMMLLISLLENPVCDAASERVQNIRRDLKAKKAEGANAQKKLPLKAKKKAEGAPKAKTKTKAKLPKQKSQKQKSQKKTKKKAKKKSKKSGPVAKATDIPSLVPTESPLPSITASKDPSSFPSLLLPTRSPSVQPSICDESGKGKGKGGKGGTKAPTRRCSTQSPSVLPSVTATEVPSQSPSVLPTGTATEVPSQIPSVLPTAITSISFSVDVCWQACGGGDFSNDADFNLVQEKILELALDGIDTDSIDVNVNTESADCNPCGGSDSQRKRFLQNEQNLLKSSIVFEIVIPDSVNATIDDTTIISNLNASLPELNQYLADNNVTTSFEGVVEQASKQPTSSPTQNPIEPPTEPPSPPPQELSTRRIAEQMNEFYSLSRNLEQSQDRTVLREQLERTFDNAHDVEDIFINSRDEQVTVTASSSKRRLSAVESEDYYDGLPDFVTLEAEDPSKCKCVDCQEDETCGGLWKGKRYPGEGDPKKTKIHIVVSHCKSNLEWISSDFTEGYDVASIHVISKCGAPVIGAPEIATIEVLPNIGRCDHTYAYYITTVLEQKMKNDDGKDSVVVVFLKDDISAKNLHQSGDWNDFESLLRIASSDNGFACGVIPDHVEFGQNHFFLSTYHEVKTLFEFSMGEYARNLKRYAIDNTEFKSEHENLGSWYASLGAGASQELVQVCYGGVFAASVSNIKKRDVSIWKAIEKSLSRGNNIQEGHYAERSWASLLSTPLQPFQIEALLDKSDGVYINKNSMHGALLKRPKLYLHIGVDGTTSTDLLTESLVRDINKLKSDGYNVAVHGKGDGGVYGFPNIDRLGACMWSDINKSQFPEHLKEAAICPEPLLTDLSEYMKQSVEESQDLVMLNPWLVRPGTAESLGTYFDQSWDVNVVIYYRRYFEWITIIFENWRQDLLENTIAPHAIPSASFRYIDFLREYCKRLFYGKDVNEDGFPVRSLSGASHDDGIMKTTGKVYFNQFDPTTNFEVEELTDLQEYTYFVAKQYYSQSRFRHGVNIVNYHDIRGPETNFYCHVLHDAHNACKAAVDREQASAEPLEMKHQEFSQLNPTLPFKPAQAFEEIVIAAYTAGMLHFDDTKSRNRFSGQILLWMDMIHSALQKMKIPIASLPMECLYQFEIDRLLEVSLAYEKALLPGFFASSNGADTLESEYLRWRFCSVETAVVLEDPQWDFLFEAASDYTIPNQPKAYIHIGAPKTGSTSIQDTMTMDKSILEQDKYFLAMHGQVTKKGKPDDRIIDNTLVQCDRLGACVWSDEQRQIVVQGSGNRNAGVCPEYLPSTFDKFLSKAIAAKSNVVISNEWLNRPTSETGLLKILDGWDPIIVIYYRRFFDWMISAHYQWHFDLGVESLESLQGRVRLIDFMRMFCGRLFASNVAHSPDDSDLSFVDLTDIQEYTYHAWKRYKNVPQYDNNIKIVNFHDGHIVKSFYCDVLGAERACKVETERLENNGSVQTRSKASTAYVDLAIGLYWKDKSLLVRTNGEESSEPVTMKTFTALGDRFKERMTEKGLAEDDLPKECLTDLEQTLLLNVSLAYEKILQPGSYASEGGDATRQHFAKKLANSNFCSVDLDGVLMNPKWSFLFEDSSSFSVKV